MAFTIKVNGAEHRRPHAAAMGPARRARHDRHQVRLRLGALRRLHSPLAATRDGATVRELSPLVGILDRSSAINAIILIDQALDQPLTRWTRRRLVLMRDLQGIHAAPKIEQLQVNESASVEVGAHHRLRHASPTYAIEQERMLGGEITEPPDVYTDDPIVALASDRLLRQNKLKMLPRGPQLPAARAREWMSRSSHGDESDSLKMNHSQTFVVHVNGAADRNVGGATAQRALNLAKRFDLQTKRYGREFGVKTLERLDKPVARKHVVDDDRHLALEAIK